MDKNNLAFSNIFFGVAVKILYFLVIGRLRKIFIFSGVCNKVNKRSHTFSLQNFHGREKVVVSFIYNSPFIIRLEKLKSYNFSSEKKKKRRTKKDFNITYWNDPSYGFMFISSLKRALDTYDYLYNVAQNVSERKRLRRKFRV